MRSRRLLVWLAIALLLMQQVGLRHGLSHALPGGALAQQVLLPGADRAADSDSTGTPADSACLECLALAALGSGLLPALLVLAVAAQRHATPATQAVAQRPARAAAYRARGPPLFLAL